jgi:hypothetical protein
VAAGAAVIAFALRWTLLVCLGLSQASAAADIACDSGPPHVVDPAKRELGPRHHPFGRPLPAAPGFNAPDRCSEGIWFFDQNGNGIADAAEPRLFGPQRVVDCDSCHGDSADPKSLQSASVFLRQDASRLCLVCHRI